MKPLAIRYESILKLRRYAKPSSITLYDLDIDIETVKKTVRSLPNKIVDIEIVSILDQINKRNANVLARIAKTLSNMTISHYVFSLFLDKLRFAKPKRAAFLLNRSISDFQIGHVLSLLIDPTLPLGHPSGLAIRLMSDRRLSDRSLNFFITLFQRKPPALKILTANPAASSHHIDRILQFAIQHHHDDPELNEQLRLSPNAPPNAADLIMICRTLSD
jgi:hypothetical protein